MIDFKLNNLGDIDFEMANRYPAYQIDFVISKRKVYVVSFMTKNEKNIIPMSNNYKIIFQTRVKDPKIKKKIIAVSDDIETLQAIAIRLKTELGELKYNKNLGSELSRMMHQDLLSETTLKLIEKYSEEAVKDINEELTAKATIEETDGYFGLETIKIHIYNKTGNMIYEYIL